MKHKAMNIDNTTIMETSGSHTPIACKIADAIQYPANMMYKIFMLAPPDIPGNNASIHHPLASSSNLLRS